MIQENPDFFRFVLFFDETKFYSDGQLNRHNCHYWLNENPHWQRSVDHQHRWSLMIWCEIINGYLIGPYFFERNVDTDSYLELLKNWLPGLLENVDLETRRRMWMQQDGAAPHYARRVRNFLDAKYNRRWVGRGDPVDWAPSSPDITPQDFFLWGHLKNVVFAERSTTREDMMDCIRRACREILRDTLLKTMRHFQRRLNLCLEADKGNFEHLLCG